eukprot:SAG22_NODE_214_length_15003_cov_18.466519_24_plen_62_part_00
MVAIPPFQPMNDMVRICVEQELELPSLTRPPWTALRSSQLARILKITKRHTLIFFFFVSLV